MVSNTGQNLRIDPVTAAVTVDAPLAFAAGDPNAGQTPGVDAIAYDHKNGGATAYAIDSHFGRDLCAAWRVDSGAPRSTKG